MSVGQILGFLVLMLPGMLFAQSSSIAIGAKASTLGIGPELNIELLPGLNARAGINWLKVGYDDTINDIDYDLNLNLQSISAH